MGNEPSKEQEFKELEANLKKVKSENADEIRETKSSHDSEKNRLEMEISVAAGRLKELKENIDKVKIEQNQTIYEMKKSFNTKIEEIKNAQKTTLRDTEISTENDIQEISLDFEKQMTELEEKNAAENEKLKVDFKNQMEEYERDIVGIYQDKSSIRNQLLDYIENNKKTEGEKLQSFELSVKEQMDELFQLKLDQIAKLRKSKEEENKIVESSLKSLLNNQIIYNKNQWNQKIAMSFYNDFIIVIGDTNCILQEAMVYKDYLKNNECKACYKELIEDWLTSVTKIPEKINILRGYLTVYSSASQNLRESVQNAIAEVESEYRRVLFHPKSINMALENNDHEKVAKLYDDLSSHQTKIEEHRTQMSKILVEPDTTLKSLQNCGQIEND